VSLFQLLPQLFQLSAQLF
jgi:hypothetical protein